MYLYGCMGCCGTWAHLPSWPQQGTRLRTLRLYKDPSHRSLILALLHSRQPTLWLHDLCLEVITLHGNELRLFFPRHNPYSNYQCLAPDRKEVWTIFNVFCYDTVWAEIQTYHLMLLLMYPQSKWFNNVPNIKRKGALAAGKLLFLFMFHHVYLQVLLSGKCRMANITGKCVSCYMQLFVAV